MRLVRLLPGLVLACVLGSSSVEAAEVSQQEAELVG